VVDGPTVQTVLGELVVRFPDLRGVLLDGSGRLRTMHRAFLNGEELLGDEVSRSVGAEDELALLTAIAGG
jgi:molybdopterin converting factor small subunit